MTVALIGADGAGKTTIGRWLTNALPVPVAYLYMGVNAEGGDRLLPTTRLARAVKRRRGTSRDEGGPPDRSVLDRPRLKDRGAWRAGLAGVRASLRLGNRLAEEWYRQLLANAYVRRGTVVVFDRHYFADFYAFDIAGGGRRSCTRRLHGFLLSHAYPKPDLTIFLDAPPEVLFLRKGEGSVEALAQRRQDYLAVSRHCRNFTTIDASRPLEAVKRDVASAVTDFIGRGGQGPTATPAA